jgi:hypothetical protein
MHVVSVFLFLSLEVTVGSKLVEVCVHVVERMYLCIYIYIHFCYARICSVFPPKCTLRAACFLFSAFLSLPSSRYVFERTEFRHTWTCTCSYTYICSCDYQPCTFHGIFQHQRCACVRVCVCMCVCVGVSPVYVCV